MTIPIDDWCFLCQIMAIGFIIGLIVGDVCDKCDPLHWKYWDKKDEQ